MKRVHTESDEMVRDFAELRKQGVDRFGCQVTKADGSYLKTQIKKTAQGVSSYANRMYRKYGDGTTVEVFYFIVENGVGKMKTYCTYG